MKNNPSDLKKTIEQFEGSWDNYDPPTPLVEKVHAYRKIPIGQLTTEQLRLLIGQNVGLKHLFPLALQKLNENIFAEGDLYKGDLLSSVLTIEKSFWEAHTNFKAQMTKLLLKKRTAIENSNYDNEYRKLLANIDEFISTP